MWPVPNQKPKGTTKTDKCYFYFFKNYLTGPGSSLLPFLPGFCLYLLVGFLLQLVVALPRHLLGQPQSSFSLLWPGATHFSRELPSMAGYEGSLLDKPCEWFLVGLEDLNFKVVREFFVVIFAAMSVHQVLEKW